MGISRRKLIVVGSAGLLGAGMYLGLRGYGKPKIKPVKRYVDIHRHVVPPPWSMGKSLESQLESSIAWMNANNVEQAIVQMSYYIDEGETYDSSVAQDRLRIIRRYSDRLITFVSIHPNTPHKPAELVAILSEMKELGAMGFGEFKIKGYAVDDPKCMAVYAACSEVGLPVLLHIDHKHCFDEPGLPHLENILKNFPRHTFVGHAQGWWASISDDLDKQEDLGKRPTTPIVSAGAIQRLMDSYPNLYGDLAASSGLNAITRDPEYTLKFFDKYQDRLMFGTDTAPVLLPDWGHFEVYENLALPEVVEAKILRDNARRVFKLPTV